MILATHALAGAAIGKHIANPWLIIFLSLIVHFLMDSFRHGEYFDSRVATIKDTAWKVALDLFIGGSLILFYFFYASPDYLTARNILLGSFFSLLPDLTTLIFWKYKFNFLSKIKKIHEFSHRYEKFPKFSSERQWTFRNASNDIIFSTIFFILLFIK